MLRCMRKVFRAILGAATWLGFDWGVGLWLCAIDLWRGGAATNTANILLGFGAVVTCIGFDSLLSPCSMVACKVLELIRLRVGDFGRILDVMVDNLLVGHVDQGAQVQASDSN